MFQELAAVFVVQKAWANIQSFSYALTESGSSETFSWTSTTT